MDPTPFRTPARGTLRARGVVTLVIACSAGLLAAGALAGPTVATGPFEVRGKFENVTALTPSPPLAAPANRRAFYWEEQQIARAIRPNFERDFVVVLNGPDITTPTGTVVVPIVGGKCNPNTALVRPNVSFTLANNDWMDHEFYVAKPDSDTPIQSVPAEVTQTRGTRAVTIGEAGTYLLRDMRQPQFRCWIVVGNNPGKILPVAPDGTFHSILSDKDYVIKVWFEGRSIADLPAKIVGNKDLPLSVNLGGPTAPLPGAATTAAAGGTNAATTPGSPVAPGTTTPATGTTPPAGGATTTAAHPPTRGRRHGGRGH